jgi:hypothetical protein
VIIRPASGGLGGLVEGPTGMIYDRTADFFSILSVPGSLKRRSSKVPLDHS